MYNESDLKLGEDLIDAKEKDRQFREMKIKRIVDMECCFRLYLSNGEPFCLSKEYGVEAKPGDLVRLYYSTGGVVRGVDINGRGVFYQDNDSFFENVREENDKAIFSLQKLIKEGAVRQQLMLLSMQQDPFEFCPGGEDKWEFNIEVTKENVGDFEIIYMAYNWAKSIEAKIVGGMPLKDAIEGSFFFNKTEGPVDMGIKRISAVYILIHTWKYGVELQRLIKGRYF